MISCCKVFSIFRGASGNLSRWFRTLQISKRNKAKALPGPVLGLVIGARAEVTFRSQARLVRRVCTGKR
jgi:hypothetical protein